MKYTVPLVCIYLFTMSLAAQDRELVTAIFGKISQADYEFNTYDKDPDVAAVVLYESGFNHFKEINNQILLIKSVHRKIKILDASRFKLSEIDIPYYHDGSSGEKVKKVEAITHNGAQKTQLQENAIYDVDLTDKVSLKRFTFPNIMDGSIIEYQYEIQTPYFFNFGDWNFQGELPKLYSELKADIPANFIYKRSLRGKRPLDIEMSELKKECFDLYILSYSADCESFQYAMFDIPAYKEEPFMLSKNNYISRLSFEYTEYVDLEGKRTSYSKTWDDVDDELKKEKNVGRQLTKENFFENNLPAEISTIKDPLERAKEVYQFIQNHYSWDGSYAIFDEVRVKEAFKQKKGNITEINLSLINALRASGLNAQLALGSTRNNGFVSDLYPTLSEFNYVLAHLVINDKTYLLDATDKFLSFNMLPFKTLNGRVRVMDFEQGSYWEDIKPKQRTMNYYKYNLELSNDLAIEGKLEAIFAGYEAYYWRKKLNEEDSKALVNLVKNTDFEFLELTYDSDKDNTNRPLKVNLDVDYKGYGKQEFFYINPLVLDFELLENPFESMDRYYPVDLGHSRAVTYDFILDIPKNFEIINLPKSKRFELENNKGSCSIIYEKRPNQLHCLLRFKLSASYFETDSYSNLQAFYSSIVEEHRNATVKIDTK